jgi:PAS domain S-box-containing protein
MGKINETKEQLLEEVSRLRKRVLELEGERIISREDRLKLLILDQAPFTMWACNRNFEIVLWAGSAPQIYERAKEEALGKNYLQLFVDPPEREQSEIDCLKIIDLNYVQKNFLAYDDAKDGTRRTMLTNCFRIFDKDRGEYLQAEVALEVGDLELRKEEHRTLREVGIERLIRHERIMEIERRKLISLLQETYSEKIRTINRQQHDLDQWTSEIRQRMGSVQAEELTKDRQKRILTCREKLEEQNTRFSARISLANNIEELGIIQNGLESFAKEPEC